MRTTVRRVAVSLASSAALAAGLLGASSAPASATTGSEIAAFANLQVGKTCPDIPGCMPIYDGIWCAVFAKWVWQSAGVGDLSGLNGFANSFVIGYGARHPGSVSDSDPQVGDAAVYGLDTSGTDDDHVNIVVAVNGDYITTVGGNENNQVSKRTFNWKNEKYAGQPLSSFVHPAGLTGPARGASLSGDRKADLVSVNGDGTITAFPNVDGINFSWGHGRTIATGWTDPSRVRFADLDGDGRAELMSVNGDGTITAFPNVDGINFSWGHGRTVATGWTDPDRVRFADLDGDGRAELMSVNGDGTITAFPNVDGINFSWGQSRTIATGWTDPSRTFLA